MKFIILSSVAVKMRAQSIKEAREKEMFNSYASLCERRRAFSEISSYDSDQLNEKIVLKKNRQTEEYKRSVRLYNFCLRILSVKLDSYQDERIGGINYSAFGRKKVKNFIRIQNPFKVEFNELKSIRTILLDFTLPLISYLFYIYIAIKYTTMAVLQSDYDSLVDKINPKLRDNSSRTEMCCLKKDIYVTDRDKEVLARLELTRSRLEALNNPIISCKTPATAFFGMLGTVPCLLFFTLFVSLVIRRRRVDVLSFYIDPFGEIRRIKKELTSVLLKTSVSIKFYYNRVSDPTLMSKDIKIKPHVDLVEMVRPANLTSKWHKTLIKLDTDISILILFAVILPYFVFILSTFSLELSQRVQQRLNSFVCQKWKPEGVLIEETIKLSPLNNQEDMLAYSTYDGTIKQFAHLMIAIELKYYLSIGIVISWLEMCLASALATFITMFCYYNYVRSFLNRIVWLNQIQEQISWSTNQIHQFKTNSEGANWYNYEDIDYNLFCKSSDKLLMKYQTTRGYKSGRSAASTIEALLVTYLNYELFRRQQPEYLKLVSTLVRQTLSLVTIVCVFSYFVGTKSSNIASIFYLIIPTYLMILLDTQLFMEAIIVSKNSRLTESILSMLAAATSNKWQLLDVVDLWRRQLLDNEETKKNFSIKVLNIRLSYESILTFDGYLVALWFILLNG